MEFIGIKTTSLEVYTRSTKLEKEHSTENISYNNIIRVVKVNA